MHQTLNYLMKIFSTISKWAVCTVLFLSQINNSKAQNEDYTLFLTQGPEKVNAKNFSGLPNGKAPNKNSYKIVQFTKIPNEKEKTILANNGIILLDYVPNYAYFAEIKSNANVDNLAQLNIRAILNIDKKYRLAPNLFLGEYPDWAVNGDKISVILNFYTGVNAQEKITQLSVLGKVENVIENTITLTLPINSLESLLNSFDYIAFIEAIDPPAQDENYYGRAMHGSSNIHLTNGLNYDGTGVTVAIGDGGVSFNHVDFTGKMTIRSTTAAVSSHATHVTGIVGGSGLLNSQHEGMAPGARLLSYNSTSDISAIPTIYNADGVRITNHSLGWTCEGGYNSSARTVDLQTATYNTLFHVFSAGNSGTENCNFYPSGWGNITGSFKLAKNSIAVANLTNSYSASSSSSRGPAFDGRIKPDIAALGSSVTSTEDNGSYSVKSGTSMAAPGVAGTMAQLIQAFRANNNNQDPKTGLMMGIVLNTAEDLGVAGPDFIFGFGKISATRAVKVIQNKTYFSNTVTTGQTRTHTINVPVNTRQMKIMVYWTDPAATSGTTKALINDIDMVVKQGSTNFLPLILNPSTTDVNLLNAPAVPGIDRINNKEQVVINNPSGTYTVDITGFAIPSGPQEYFVVYEFSQEVIEIISPVNNGSLIQGSTALITWDAIGTSGTFNIQYSLNDGASWVTINSALSGSRRSITWTVPNTTTGKAKIRVSRNGIVGETQNNFAILPRPSGLVIDFRCTNFSKLSWTTVPGADAYVVYKHNGFQMVAIGETTSNTFNVTSPSSETVYLAVAAKKDGLVGYRSAAILKPTGTTQNCNDCLPVTASSSQTGNGPENVLDNNMTTRWAADGIGQTLTFCLANPTQINSVDIAFYLGNTRTYNFAIQSSNDGITFSNVATGLVSSGTTLNKELFMFTPTTAKYFRIVGNGNSTNNFNSYHIVDFKFTQPLVNHNLSISNVAQINGTACGNSFNLSATVQNLGEITANGYLIDIYQNNVLTETKDFTTTLTKNQSVNIQINDIALNSFGNVAVKLIIKLKNNVIDQDLTNNEQQISIQINEGTEHYFYITNASVNNALAVTILNSNNQTVQTINNNSLVTQGNLKIAKFCLPQGCYTINVSNAFSSGTCSYPDWSASVIYTGDAARGAGNGEIVKFNGRIYRALWWTQNNQPGTNNVWTDLGECNTTDPNAVYGFKQVVNDSLFFENSLANYNNLATHNICIQSNIVVEFTTNNTITSHCEEITFSTNNTGNQISWDFGANANPQTANGVGPHKVNYLKPGLKTVSLNVDGKSTLKSNYITVNENLNYRLQIKTTTNGTNFCEGEDINLSATIQPTANGSWIWKNNSQRFNGADLNFVAVKGNANYNAVFYPNDVCVLSDSVESEFVAISVAEKVNASISINSSEIFPICPTNSPISFKASPINGGNNPIISWFKNNELQFEGEIWNTTNLNKNDTVFATLQSNANCLKNDIASSNTIYVEFKEAIQQTFPVPTQGIAAGFDTYNLNLHMFISNPSFLNVNYQITTPSQIVSTSLIDSILNISYNELFGEDSVIVTATDECNQSIDILVKFIVDGNGLSSVNINGVQARIYPNPFHHNITVTKNNNELMWLEITDVNGKIIGLHEIDAEIKTLQLINMPAGMYFGKLYNDTFTKTFKLIKQH
jgi:hypothetical protein